MSNHGLKILAQHSISNIYGDNLPYPEKKEEYTEEELKAFKEIQTSFREHINGLDSFKAFIESVKNNPAHSESLQTACDEIETHFPGTTPSTFLNYAYKYELDDQKISDIMTQRQQWLEAQLNSSNDTIKNKYLKRLLANEYFAAGKIDDAITTYEQLDDTNKYKFIFNLKESLNGICGKNGYCDAISERILKDKNEIFTKNLDHKIAMLCLKDPKCFEFFLPSKPKTSFGSQLLADEPINSALLKINMAVAARIVEKEPNRINDVLPNLNSLKDYIGEDTDNEQLRDYSVLCKAHFLINGDKKEDFIDGFPKKLEDISSSHRGSLFFNNSEKINDINSFLSKPNKIELLKTKNNQIKEYNTINDFKERILNSVTIDGNKRKETSEALNELLKNSTYHSADEAITLIKNDINSNKGKLFSAINKVRHPTLLKIKDTVLRKKHNTKSLDKVLELTKTPDTKPNESPKATK